MSRPVKRGIEYTKNALLMFVLLAFMYGYYFHKPGNDGNTRLSLVFAFVKDRSLTIDRYYNAEGMGTDDFAVVDGHDYTDKAIGPSLIGAAMHRYELFIKLTHSQPDMNETRSSPSFDLPRW